jgi:hypothetical protein
MTHFRKVSFIRFNISGLFFFTLYIAMCVLFVSSIKLLRILHVYCVCLIKVYIYDIQF